MVPFGDSTVRVRGADGVLSGITIADALLAEVSTLTVFVIVTIFVSYIADGSTLENCAECDWADIARTVPWTGWTMTGVPNEASERFLMETSYFTNVPSP